MVPEFEPCYRAVASRDARFDGWFVTAVTTTGIYCRPSCPAITPRRGNVRILPSAAAAQQQGFRACKRCRPDASPGSPEWNVRGDVTARAMLLLADGMVDREGVPGLAAALGYSERHLNRLLTAELGAGPLALARSQRAQTARLLIETTDLPFADVAFAAGFSSIRQFNDTVLAVFATSPTTLRAAGARRAVTGDVPAGGVVLRLAYRAPYAAGRVLTFLGARAVAGVEEYDGARYRRSLALPHGPAVAELSEPAAAGHVVARLRLTDLRDLTTAVHRVRRLLDLDADPQAVDAVLGADRMLGPLVRAVPGRRVPGSVDPAETAVRTVIGQQVSVAAARTHASRLVAAYGKPLEHPDGALTHLWPEPAALAEADDAVLAFPATRRRTVRGLAHALATGDVRLDPGVDRREAARALRAVPGVGPWTAAYVALRALADPDALPAGDLGLRRALCRLGGPTSERGLDAASAAWRPWRAYAAVHLWATLETR